MIAIDKKAHFLGGIACAAGVLPFGLAAAVVVTIAVAAFKEVIYDHFFGGTPDTSDFLATVLGAGVYLGWIQWAGAYL